MSPSPCHALGALAIALLAGCWSLPFPTTSPVPTGDTEGDLGHVDLTYVGPVGGDVCSQGCALGMPLMAGNTEGIAIGPHVASPVATLPPLTFESSDPVIFDVSPRRDDGVYPSERRTSLQGLARGSATLLLHDATSGTLFDSTTVRVEPAASISMSFQLQVSGPTPTTTGDLVLAVGQQAVWIARVLDAGGEPLAAWSAVSLEIADESIAAIEPGSLATITALAKGQTTLTARAGAASTVVTVTVLGS